LRQNPEQLRAILLAVPTMVAATGLDLFKNASSFSQGEWLLIALGFVSTFITALLAIKWFITFVQNHSFSWFGIYRILAGLLILLFLL
jgi:undecaprenyl-diphosphatase